MTDARTAIITAAVTAAGPVGDDTDDTWTARVGDLAARITVMCQDGSDVAAIVDGIGVAKRFTATVLAVTREQSSTRALVRLRTAPSQFHADGLEDARSERTDRPSGLAMARRLTMLVGHRVLLWVEVAVMNGGAGKVRVIRHVEDLGVDAAA